MSKTTMRTKSEPNVSPFTTAVVETMRRLYPEKLADSSFDNTGILLEAPYRPGHLKNVALLTIDLTKAVANEAIRLRSSVIIAYHPIIFRPLTSITQSNTQQNTLLRLAQEGISVYSPHTAVDAAQGGINDWLCDIVTGYASKGTPLRAHTRTIINALPTPVPDFETAGYGRIVTFNSPLSLGSIIRNIAHLKLKGVSVAVPQALSNPVSKWSHPIKTVGICAGSGGSMLNNLDVDLLFTGELSHHEALAAIEQGKCVITAGHSNTERGFLSERMEGLLKEELGVAILGMGMRNDFDEGGEGLEHGFEIVTSKVDRDPFEIVGLGEGGWADGV